MKIIILLRKLIVSLLLILILYKAVEPFVYSLIVYNAKLTIAHNIQKVLDHYNDDTSSDQSTVNTIQKEKLSEKINIRQNKTSNFSVALNGNRITAKLVNEYSDYIKNLLKQQSEIPKSQMVLIGDLNSKYICPSYILNEVDSLNIKNKVNWIYLISSVPHIKTIPVPPPQSIPV